MRKLIATAVAAVLLFGLTPLPEAAAVRGVTRRVVRIGVHAPITGAAPLATSSVEQGARVLWRWLRLKDRAINGRHVRVVLRNDQTNPSTAVAVCKEMVEEKNVFLLASIPGSLSNVNQAQACARYAASVGVPYVGPGYVKPYFRRLPTYFALTATAERQAWLLADHLLTDLAARRNKVGVVTYDSPTFTPFLRRFEAAMAKRKDPVEYSRTIPSNSGTAEARTIVQEMQLAGIDQVTIYTTPIFFLNLLQQADSTSYNPLWVGPGPNMTHETVIDAACGNTTRDFKLRFFSPAPAFYDRDRFDPRHDRAMERIYSDLGDDVTWLGWGSSKALRVMLVRTGRRLTQRRFVSENREGPPIKTGVLPPIRFRGDPFGGRGVHVLVGNCSPPRWETVRTFVSNFRESDP